jgi:polar amino acid transport system substrate-binding protein
MKRPRYWLFLALLLTSLVLSACAQEAATQAPAATTAAAETEAPMDTAEAPAETEAAEPPAGSGDAMTVRVATDATWPPFESVDESTKEIVGFDVDLMNAIAEEANLQVEYNNVPWDSLLAGMAQCQYDAAISAMTITPERAEQFAFSDPYFAAGQIVTVRADNTDIQSKDTLSGKTIGVQLGTTGDIQAQEIDGATVKTYDDIGLAFQDLINGQVDAVIADNPLALGYVGQNSDTLKTVGEVFTDESYGIAVCKDNTELVERINQGLAAVQASGTLDELTQKWVTGSGQ